MAAFRFATDVRVRFAETDAQGVAHNAAYLVWFEVARVDYLARPRRRLPGAPGARRSRRSWREANIRYGAPARFDDRLRIQARCVDVRGARFRFEYAIEREGELIADGWTTHACVDAPTHRPTRVPAWLVEAIARAESPDP